MATHCSILAWKIPRTEEPEGLPSLGLQRIIHHWETERHHHMLAWPISPFNPHSPEGWQQLHFTIKMRTTAQKSKDRTKDQCKSRFKSNSPYASFHNEGLWILHEFLSSIRFYTESGKSSSQGCTFSDRAVLLGFTKRTDQPFLSHCCTWGQSNH